MKHRIRGLVFLLLITTLSFFLFSVVTYADDPPTLRIDRVGGLYVLSECRADGETVLAEGTLPAVTDALSAYASSLSRTVSVVFEEIESDTTLTFAVGAFRFLGELTFLGDAKLVVSGADVTLGDLTLSFGREGALAEGYVRVKDGSLTVDGATVRAGDRYAVLLDYAAGAELTVRGGTIRSSSSYATVHAATGTVSMTGGEIENTGGHAVYSATTLRLGSTPTLRGVDAEILTEGPLWLASDGVPFGGEVRVRYRRLFEKGMPFAVAFDACDGMQSRITLYDRDGERMPLSYMSEASFTDEERILSVYRPYTVRFMADGACVSEQQALRDESVTVPTPPAVEGYTFFGWCLDEGGTVPFSGRITADTTVYAVYRLAPPEYRLSSVAFTYDGVRRTLAFDRLTHPLAERGVFTYAWYKDAAPLDLALPYVPLVSVADSGVYTCEVTLTVGGDRVTITTAEVAVSVSAQAVAPPVISSVPYTAVQQVASVLPSAYYTVVQNDGGVHAGVYPVVLALTDPENTVWESTQSAEPLTLTFSVLQAQNAFIQAPSVTDTFVGHGVSVSFATLFGDGVCLFSRDEQGTYTPTLPTQSGTWFVRVSVEETPDYTALLSPPQCFTVYEVIPSALQLTRAPDVSAYTAFDTFSPVGMELSVVMNDGSRHPVAIEDVGVRYTDGRSYLSCADGFVFITYAGLTLPVAVTVEPATYDMSGVSLSPGTAVFNGKQQTLSLMGGLPVGLDGSSPTVVLDGGGCAVGQYTVTARFIGVSREYRTPDPMTAQLTITPCPVTVSWSSTDLVYNGAYQAPTASAYDLDGVPLLLTVSGAACYAGASYEAYCTLANENYAVENPSVTFCIRKALYDLSDVRWSGERFIYDGTVHTVCVLGLPEGVTVLGYTDASASAAGRYTALCTLSYDSQNYEEPVIAPHAYEVMRGTYDMSGVVFSPTVHVYNGSMQYPEQTGYLPVGADGSVPLVSMSDGATHVTDGTVTVTVTFRSTSDNYEDPPPVTATVSIAPCAVDVTWGERVFVYDGTSHLPTAQSDIVPILVSGGRVDAGVYVATAYTENPDYTVTNAKCDYRIEQADNAWLVPLRVEDIVEGGTARFEAEALFGAVQVLVYTDAQLTQTVDVPLTPGVYYAVARVVGEKNYKDLFGESVAFSVIERRATALLVTLAERTLHAFETLSDGDFFAQLIYNDGSRVALSSEQIRVAYECGNCLLATDTEITFGYGDFTCPVTVTVERMALPTPNLTEGIFSGEWQSASVPTDAPYEILTAEGGREVGSYAVTLVLRDAVNVCFAEGGGDRLVVSFTVKPRPITVTVDDVYLYLDTKRPQVSYRLTQGTLVEGEDPALSFIVRDGQLVAHAANASYEVTFVLGEVHALNRLSGERRAVLFAVFLVTLALILATLLARRIARKRRLRRYVTCGLSPTPPVGLAPYRVPQLAPMPHASSVLCEPTADLAEARMPTDAEQTSEPIQECVSDPIEAPEIPTDAMTRAFTSVDVRRADALISDALATHLVTDLSQVIETFGSRRVILNVDALNEVFSSGERVDVNVLKDRYLIPYDAGYLKILADGSLDKALEVYADSFSMQAVKMIALTGGRAVRVRTVSTASAKKRKKRGKNGKRP